MDKYDIVISFSSDKAYVNIADERTSSFFFGDPAQYSTRVFVDQNGNILCGKDGDNLGLLSEGQKDYRYVDNILMELFDNYISKTDRDDTSVVLFAKYLYYIVKDFVKYCRHIPRCELPNINLTIVTPRRWGYLITDTDIQTIVAKSGVTQNVVVYNDLNVRIDDIQRSQTIGRLRTCLFCSFFLTTGPLLDNSIAKFFSGTFYALHTGNIKPVNCRSLPPVTPDINVASLYSRLKGFTLSMIPDRYAQLDGIIDNCFSLLVQFLKQNSMNQDTENKTVLNLKKLYPFRQVRSNEDQSSQNGHYVPKDNTEYTLTIIHYFLKDVSIQDMYDICKPLLEPFVCALQSVLQQYSAREIFLELFKKPSRVDKVYVHIALVGIYFIQYSLGQRNDEYVHVYFTNIYGSSDAKDDDYALHSRMRGHFSIVRTFQRMKTASELSDPKLVISKENIRNPRQTVGEKEKDIIVNLDLSLEKSRICVLSRAQKSEEYKVNRIRSDNIESFGDLEKLYLERCNNSRNMTTKNFAKETYQTADRDFDDFDVDNFQGKFHYQPKKLETLDDILFAMCEIKSISQSPQFRLSFKCHRMKILLTLYIMYLDEKIDLKKTSIGYIVILDPLLDEIIGKKQSLIRCFAQEFGLFAKDEDVKKNMTIFKKRRAYIWKLQEDPIFWRMPVLETFLQIQITKTYCQATYNTVLLDNQKLSSVEDRTKLFKYNFCDHIVENFWRYLETGDERTLASFEVFKTQMGTYVDQLLVLEVNDELDSSFHIKMDNSLVEFTHRTVIEVAVMPAIEKIVSFIWFVVLRYGTFPKPPWHTFLMLENFTEQDIDTQTNMLQQVLKYEIKNRLGVLYDNNMRFDKSDYSITEINDVDLCCINNEPFGLHSLTTGITHLHRTTNSTYAVKFYTEDNSTEGFNVYEIGSFHTQKLEEKIDINVPFIIAKAGEKFKLSTKGFRIQNDFHKVVYIDFYRMLDPINLESIGEARLECQLMGSLYFSEKFFESKEYRTCPIFVMNALNIVHLPAFGINIFTLSSQSLLKQLFTHEPFSLCSGD